MLFTFNMLGLEAELLHYGVVSEVAQTRLDGVRNFLRCPFFYLERDDSGERMMLHFCGLREGLTEGGTNKI